MKKGLSLNNPQEGTTQIVNAERYIRQFERTAVLFPQHKECTEFANYVLDSKGKPQWETVLKSVQQTRFWLTEPPFRCQWNQVDVRWEWLRIIKGG